MKGVIKLKVPSVPKTPKLFVLVLKKPDDKQYRFSKVAYDLASAINQCGHHSYTFQLSDYVVHTELSVDEINYLFKNFRE